MKSYCDVCGKVVDYKTNSEFVIENIDNKDINYLKKSDICLECGNKFYTEDTYNFNVNSCSDAIRKQNGIITISQIEEILKKYNIGKKPLSFVLGFGEITIIRYLDGQMPERVYSDILLKILDDPDELLKYVEKNKNLITKIAYKKVISRIAEIKLEEDKSKIYLISKHIIARMEDITPLALQKLLYYIEGFSLALFDREIFNNRCEAWIHGPVYREIYDRFCYYSYNNIDSLEFSSYKDIDIDSNELKLIDAVIDNFGCYSGKILEKMTHNSLPWIKARGNLENDEASNNEISSLVVKDYFKSELLKYNINTIDDISKYSQVMFKKLNN